MPKPFMLVVARRFQQRLPLLRNALREHVASTLRARDALGFDTYRYRLRQPCWLERAATFTRHPLALFAANPPDLVELFEFSRLPRMGGRDTSRVWSELERHFRALGPVSEAMLCREHALAGPARAGGVANLSFWIRRARGQALHDMQRYWLEDHAKLALGMAATFRFERYDQLHRVQPDSLAPAHEWCPAWRSSSFDGLASVTYRDRTALVRNALYPNTWAANFALTRDERHFTDPLGTLVWVGNEHVHRESESTRCLSNPL